MTASKGILESVIPTLPIEPKGTFVPWPTDIRHTLKKDSILHKYDNLHPVTGASYLAAAVDEESFLKEVITPIYKVLLKEVKRNKGGKASHSGWRNYDDLNEYFWSDKCVKIGWPMDLNADFFGNSDGPKSHSDVTQPANERANHASNQVAAGKRKPKTNFVEVRTFFHLYRSFNRMWTFFILAFQAMLIVAWSPSGSLAAFFDADVFRSVLSIFITSAFLNLLQATLDIILSLNAWKSLKFSQILRYLLKFAVAAGWAVVLPIGYSSSVLDPKGLVKFFRSWAGDWRNQSFYSYAVALYLIPNILSTILFFLPPLRRNMERSNWRIITLAMWWAQASCLTLLLLTCVPKLFIGRGMHEDMFSLLK
uniref:1,3-beta-glucan synthase component FKS1-like domain-containing protein n=1 Tax=Fagus sylvatica TaxID=28930 RepID=A0A2N9IAE0_FAGSY